MDDIANHVLGAMEQLTVAVNSGDSQISKPPNVCDDEAQPWVYGPLFQDKLLKVDVERIYKGLLKLCIVFRENLSSL